MRTLLLIPLLLLLTSCEKPDPNPELKDPIFQDLNSDLAVITAQLNSEKNTYASNEKSVSSSIPQSGQLKVAQKHLYDSAAIISHLEQQKAYLEFKIESRKKDDQKNYKIAFKNKKEWPDPQEWKNYQEQKKARSIKKFWDVRDRFKELGFATTDKKNETPKEAPKKEE